MKKMLFISANNFAVPYPVYPLGISYLKTYLSNRMDDYVFKIYDMMNGSLDELKKEISNFEPNHIGVSFRNIDNVDFTNQEFFLNLYSDIIKVIRETTNSTLIIGGSGYSIYPQLLFQQLNPDYGIYGEGEQSLHALLLALDNGGNVYDIEGLVYKKNDEILTNPRTNYINELDLELNDELISYYWQNSGMLNIQTKRGCPYKCIYCTYPLIEGSKVRTLNSKKIVEKLKKFYDEDGIDYFFFTDSVFNISNRFNEQLAKEIIESGIKIKWGAYFAPWNLSRSFLSLLKESGLEHIEFGTESLSESQLKNYGKRFSLDDVFRVSEHCNELDINFAHFLILGGYGETDESIRETFINSSKIKRTVFFPFVGMRIYPGTELQKIAVREKVISAEDNLLAPKYFVSDKFNPASLKELAVMSGKRWVFPDEDLSDVMNKMRGKNKKGPLWEYIVK